MRRLAPFALLAVVSCNGITDGPVQLGMVVRIPQIDFDRLDDQLHLRIFPRGTYACNAASGQVTRDGAPVTDFGGGAVRPFERCGSSWNSLQGTYGTATPVDVCFSKEGDQGETVPPGDYVILVEGSNQITDASEQHYTIASGCAVQSVAPSSSATVQIAMVEQSASSGGRCGDGMVLGNEDCDDGAEGNAAGNACDEACHFTEHSAPTTTSGLRKNPTLAWTVNQPLVIGFEAQTDVWVHYFDAAGQPMASGAGAADIPADTGLARNRQGNIALAATPTGWAAGWLTTERMDNADVAGTVATRFDPSVTVPTDVILNTAAESSGAFDRRDVSVGANATAVLWGFVDGNSGAVRVVPGTPAGTPATPAPDVALADTGPGASAASGVRIAATDSGFVVVWTSNTGVDSDVYAARVSNSGMPSATPVVVSTSTVGNQDQPAVAASGSTVVVAWRDDGHADASDASGTTVRWRRFDASLAPEAGDHLAPTTVTGDQTHPTVALNAGGVALIAWQNDGDGSIRGRFFRAADGSAAPNHFDGTPGDFAVNAVAGAESGSTDGPRVSPVAAFGGMNRFALAWEDDANATQSPPASDIRVRLLIGP